MAKPMRLSRANFSTMYWTLAQMVAHHASNGCPLRTGDLIGSGTVSGPLKENRGCLLEATWRGTEPIELPTGEVRRFLENGDEVILPVPYWVSYLDMVHYAGGKVVLLETDEHDNFAVRAQAIERLITSRTNLIILNSPSNPAGTVIPAREMEQILALAVERNLLLMTDECYCHFLYDGRQRFSLGSSHNREHLIVVGSLSKTYAMTGWRVGFALGSAPLLANMLKLQSHSTSNPNSIAQKAAVEAVRGPQDSVARMLAEYNWRRDLIVSGLRAIRGVQCAMPEGAFYVYPNVRSYLQGNGLGETTALAERLLDEAHVAVVPGPAFGTHEHLRISYATSREQIEEGLRRLKDFFARM